MNPADRALMAYLEARDGVASARVGEAIPPPRPPNELELQAAFYAGEYGLSWKTLEGGRVEAVHLGEWNREPGPDFVGALLRMDGHELRGDIELDRRDADWEGHGHHANPAFDRVILHAAFSLSPKRIFIRTSGNRMVPQIILPQAPTRRAPPREIPSGHSADPRLLEGALEAAVRFRLSRKRAHWLSAEALHGTSGALFHAVASALGYKNNKIPFLLLAQRAGLNRARSPEGEAILFGLAGFLEAGRFDAASPESRSYARGLWDAWWGLRERFGRLVLPAKAWTFPAGRPANHPHRRTAALTLTAQQFPRLEAAMRKADATSFLDFFRNLRHPFWESHASLDGFPLRNPCAVVGEDRALEMAANILAPAAGLDEGATILRNLRCVNVSSKARRAIAWLGISPDLARKLSRNAHGQQALLQLYEDFFPARPEDFLPGLDV